MYISSGGATFLFCQLAQTFKFLGILLKMNFNCREEVSFDKKGVKLMYKDRRVL